MTHTATPQQARVIRAAAALYALYGNGDVAAYNRSYHAKTERSKHFWFVVGRAMYWPARGQWTQERSQMWQQIRARAALAKAQS